MAGFLREHDIDPDTGGHAGGASLSPDPGPAVRPADAPRLLRVALRIMAVREAETESLRAAITAVGTRWLMAVAALARTLADPNITKPSYTIVREWLAEHGIDPDDPPGGPAGDDTGWIVPGLILEGALIMSETGHPRLPLDDDEVVEAHIFTDGEHPVPCPDPEPHSGHEWNGGTIWCEGVR